MAARGALLGGKQHNWRERRGGGGGKKAGTDGGTDGWTGMAGGREEPGGEGAVGES